MALMKLPRMIPANLRIRMGKLSHFEIGGLLLVRTNPPSESIVLLVPVNNGGALRAPTNTKLLALGATTATISMIPKRLRRPLLDAKPKKRLKGLQSLPTLPLLLRRPPLPRRLLPLVHRVLQLRLRLLLQAPLLLPDKLAQLPSFNMPWILVWAGAVNPASNVVLSFFCWAGYPSHVISFLFLASFLRFHFLFLVTSRNTHVFYVAFCTTHVFYVASHIRCHSNTPFLHRLVELAPLLLSSSIDFILLLSYHFHANLLHSIMAPWHLSWESTTSQYSCRQSYFHFSSMCSHFLGYPQHSSSCSHCWCLHCPTHSIVLSPKSVRFLQQAHCPTVS